MLDSFLEVTRDIRSMERSDDVEGAGGLVSPSSVAFPLFDLESARSVVTEPVNEHAKRGREQVMIYSCLY